MQSGHTAAAEFFGSDRQICYDSKKTQPTGREQPTGSVVVNKSTDQVVK